MARVVLTDDAKEDLRDLDGAARKLVAKKLKQLDDEVYEIALARLRTAGHELTADLTGLLNDVFGTGPVIRTEP